MSDEAVGTPIAFSDVALRALASWKEHAHEPDYACCVECERRDLARALLIANEEIARLRRMVAGWREKDSRR